MELIVNENMKKLRKAIGLTQEEFSAIIKIKRSLLGAYEEKRAEVKTEVIGTLLEKGFILNYELRDFMFNENFEPKPLQHFLKHWIKYLTQTA